MLGDEELKEKEEEEDIEVDVRDIGQWGLNTGVRKREDGSVCD